MSSFSAREETDGKNLSYTHVNHEVLASILHHTVKIYLRICSSACVIPPYPSAVLLNTSAELAVVYINKTSVSLISSDIKAFHSCCKKRSSGVWFGEGIPEKIKMQMNNISRWGPTVS